MTACAKAFLALTVVLACLLPQPSNAAKPVFRCEVGNRVIYADEPCASSAGRSINVDDARTPMQRNVAIEAARREAAFAREARAQRLAGERAAVTQQPAGIRMASREPDEVKKTPRKRTQYKKPRSAAKVRSATDAARRV